MNAFEYISANSLAAATAFLAGEEAQDALVKAGGIDVVDRLKERIATPARVVNLRLAAKPEICIRPEENALAIGALTTLAAIADNSDVQKNFPALTRSAGEAASPQLREVATIGGNLCQKPRCWYYRSADFNCLKKGGATCYAVAGDNRYHAIFGAGACHVVHASNAAIPLLAYNARVRLVRHENGKPAERVIPLDDFFAVPVNPQSDEVTLKPGELISEVLIPLDAAGPKSAFVSVRERQAFDWPLVMAAVNLNNAAQPRVVLGAVAPIPWRLPKVESLLAGKALDAALIEQAGQAARAGAAPMSGNAYKVELVSAVVRDALTTAARG